MTFYEMDAILALVDADNSGAVGFEEFLRTSVNPKDINNKDLLMKAFRDFDVDNSKSITILELKNRLDPDGTLVPEPAWEELF